MDSTKRKRPEEKTLDEFFREVRTKYPNQIFMADCSDFEEGMHAAEIGFDIIGTTMRGYTEYTKDVQIPDYNMIEALVQKCGKPVIAEGGIWTPQQLEQVMNLGVIAAVVGTAITRPYEITKRFVKVIQK